MFDMMSNVVSNFFSKPATRLFPKVIREPFTNTRGKLGDIKINDCIFCGICERKCPSLALSVDKANRTWTVNRYKCIVCGVCVEVCPKKCLHMEEMFEFSAYEKGKVSFTATGEAADSTKPAAKAEVAASSQDSDKKKDENS